jgi:hypothetical protein
MKRLILIALISALSNVGSAQAVEPKPGLWNLTVTTTADGGGKPMGPFYRSQCLNKEDIRDPEQLFAESGMSDCRFKGQNQQGGRYDFTIQCNGALPMSGSGNVAYGAEQFQGEINLVTEIQGMDIATTSIVSGKRAGECPAQPTAQPAAQPTPQQ